MFLQLVDEELLAIAKVVKCRYVATGQVGTQYYYPPSYLIAAFRILLKGEESAFKNKQQNK